MLDDKLQSKMRRSLGLDDEPVKISFAEQPYHKPKPNHSLMPGLHAYIDCPSKLVSDRLKSQRLQIAVEALKFDIEMVNLRVDGEVVESFPPKRIAQFSDRRVVVDGCMALQRTRTFNSWDDLERLTKQNPNLKIIQLEERGNELYPSTELFSGANCTQYSGLNIEQWYQFSQDLMTHGFMTNYRWKARLYTGEECQFVGDVRLIILPSTRKGSRVIPGGIGCMAEGKPRQSLKL